MTLGMIGGLFGIAAVVGGFLLFVIRLSVSVSGSLRENSSAIKTLTDYLEKQDKRNDEQDITLRDHEGRLIEIETVHRVKGCVQ